MFLSPLSRVRIRCTDPFPSMCYLTVPMVAALLLCLVSPAQAEWVGAKTRLKPLQKQSKDVLIICTRDAVLARTEQEMPVLYSARGIEWCTVDEERALVWFGRDGSVYALDLKSDDRPAKIFSGVPKDDGETRRVFLSPAASDPNLDYALVADFKRAKLKILEGNFAFRDEDKRVRTSLEGIKVRNGRKLQQWARRRGKKKRRPRCPRRVTVEKSACDDPKVCGNTEAIAGTNYCRVVVAQSCGDGCDVEFKLYDVRQKHVVEDPPFEPRVNVRVSPSGKAFATDEQVVTFGGEILIRDRASHWTGVGWAPSS